ncbi:MAG TPA: type II secretion system F family protein [Streptosporangiaceae bacterium]|nr:type II secretion system F family protein [Streptosporangiaceae bacterium]
MTLLFALTGGLVACGLVLLVAELTRKAPPPGVPSKTGLTRANLSDARTRRLVIAVGVALAMLAISRWPVAAIGAGFGVYFVPTVVSAKTAKRRTAVLEGLEQWTRRLADMLSASRGLEDALEASARSAPAVIAPQVTALARRLSARVGTQDALRAFADEINHPAGDRIVAALLIVTSQRGGGVHGVLTTLAELLARDVAARREIEASRAEHKTTLRWIIGFVSGFTIFAILNRSYSGPYGTLTGECVLGVVALLYATGLWWLHRLGEIPEPGRFLDEPPVWLDLPEAQPLGSGGVR